NHQRFRAPRRTRGYAGRSRSPLHERQFFQRIAPGDARGRAAAHPAWQTRPWRRTHSPQHREWRYPRRCTALYRLAFRASNRTRRCLHMNGRKFLIAAGLGALTVALVAVPGSSARKQNPAATPAPDRLPVESDDSQVYEVSPLAVVTSELDDLA